MKTDEEDGDIGEGIDDDGDNWPNQVYYLAHERETRFCRRPAFPTLPSSSKFLSILLQIWMIVTNMVILMVTTLNILNITCLSHTPQ